MTSFTEEGWNSLMTWTFTEPEVGDNLVDRYRLEQVLGRGGFGVVFRAHDLKTERTVALKVLHATYARKDPKAVERFRREAILSASIGYPNSVRVFDYGETPEGVFFLVMEFLRGSTLSKILRDQGPLNEELTLHVTRQILQSAMEAHAHGIVHRDFKPENVMIVPLKYDPWFVKVMDFGIAKMAISTGPQITQAGQTFGTPRYMAPEQLQGGQLSPATDLYAVGLIMYEMLTGLPAIQAQSLGDTISAVIMGPEVELPLETPASEMCRALLRKACLKDPTQRFTSAQSFLSELEIVVEQAYEGPTTDMQEPRHIPLDPNTFSAETLALDTSGHTEMVTREPVPPASTHRVVSAGGSGGGSVDGASTMMRLGCVLMGVLAGLAVVIGLAVLLFVVR